MGSALTYIGPIVAPLFALLLRFVSDGHDGARSRRIKRYSEMLEQIPAAADAVPLVEHLNSEIKVFAERQGKLSNRKLDGGSLGALILIGAVTSLATWALSYLSLNVHGAFWLLTAPVLALGLALMIAGVSQLYKYPDEGS